MDWYPSADYIIQLHAIIMKQYSERERPYGCNRGQLEGILDRLRYGLPMKNQDFLERTSYFFYDMIKLHCFEDGNKRIAQTTLDILLYNNGFRLNTNQREKELLNLEIANSLQEERLSILSKIQIWFNNHH